MSKTKSTSYNGTVQFESHKEETTKPKEPSKTELITEDYASTLVNELLSSNDSVSIFNAIKKLKFYDSRLQQLGYRAAIKVGTVKLD